MSVLEAPPSTVREANEAPSDYWLEQSEGFQVFGPHGRSVFVPVHEVGSVVPGRQRLELLITPRVPRARISDIGRELFAPAADQALFQRAEAAPVPCTSDGRR